MVPDTRRPDWIASAIALLVGLAGVISAVSALTPALADRLALLASAVPLAAPRTAAILTAELGVVLTIAAFGLRRRQRQHWVVAMTLLLVISALHLTKGLDVEESGLTLFVAGLLLLTRRRFPLPGNPDAMRRAFVRGLATSVGGLVVGIGLLEAAGARAGNRPSLAEALSGTAHALVGGTSGMLWLYTAVALAAIAWLALRPAIGARTVANQGRERARSLIQRVGGDGLAYFALRRDKSYLFANDGRAMLAYRVVAGVALISGDAIGDDATSTALINRFHAERTSAGQRVAAIGLPAAALPKWWAAGLRTAYIGDEAIVIPAEFGLEGRAMRVVRQSHNRVHRLGYAIQLLRRDELSDALVSELRRVSDEWLGGKGERGFSMALDAPWDPEHADCIFAVGFDPAGRPVGYIHFVPTYLPHGLSLSTMRRTASAPSGLMDAILAETFLWSRSHGVERVSLNFSAFGGILRSADARGWQRLAAHILLRGERWFQIERLNAFNRKFQPRWEPRYSAFERPGDLPAVVLATLLAERLIHLPQRPAKGSLGTLLRLRPQAGLAARPSR